MRINPENKSVDMEQRDTNFTLPPYVRNYQFHNKNELPDKIIFPMFPAVNVVGADGKMHLIAIEYIAPDSAVAKEIAQDGADVPEVTPAQEAVIDEKDEEIKRLKAEVESLTPSTQEPEPSPEEPTVTPAPEDLIRQQEETDEEPEVSPAKQAFAEAAGESVHETEKKRYEAEDKKIDDMAEAVQRVPKQPPGGDIGPGLSPSDNQPRDAGDQIMTAKALRPEPDIKEDEEKPFEKEIKRDEKGNPIVEDKPDVAD